MEMKWSFTGHPATLEDVLSCVGQGWHKLVTDLVADLERLGWDGNVAQVKEKFGGLRFYIGGGTKAIYDRIVKAERDSFTICEECGRPGEPISDGWIRSLCPEHANRG